MQFFDDFFDGPISLHHLLMVAVALGWCPRPYSFAHHHVGLHLLLLVSRETEDVLSGEQELEVPDVFGKRPETTRAGIGVLSES